ncbi:MAG TPA: hypothetical protein DCR24_04100, partial [Bacillus bacterium]|nr:hypothetical protein [Bacillus sp. (in: firmicutes)]
MSFFHWIGDLYGTSNKYFNNKRNLLVRSLIILLTIHLLLNSHGFIPAALNLGIGVLLMWATAIKRDKYRHIFLAQSFIFFMFAASLMDLTFLYYLSFLYPLLFIVVFLLPNPFYLNVYTVFSAILLLKYNTEGFDSFEGNLIVLLANGMVYSVMLYLIKKLSRKNEELKKEKETTKTILSLMPEPVIIHTVDEILYTNQEGIKMVGLEDESEVLGKSVLDFLHKNNHRTYKEKVPVILDGTEIARHNEYKVIKTTGEIIDIECSSVPINYEKTPALITVVHDVTVKNRATDELILNSEKLKIVGQMAAGIAHELKNPLTSIKGFIQLIRDNQVGKDKEYVDIVLTEVERLNGIVSEFLFMSKPQMIQFKNVNIISLMIVVLKLLQPQAVMNNIIIKNEFDLNVPLIKGDENQIKQVLVNLIKNAIEAMPTGGYICV